MKQLHGACIGEYFSFDHQLKTYETSQYFTTAIRIKNSKNSQLKKNERKASGPLKIEFFS